MRSLILGLGFVAATLMLMVATSIAGEREVVVLDECDPATFNAALVPDTCINAVGAPELGAPVTFTDFLGALPTGHPAWLFQPGKLIIRPGRTVRATNEGGEVHTFTEVAKFGGGFITALNNPSGSSPVPECAGGFLNANVAATRVVQHTSRVVTGLAPGKHLFQCCIHPWMHIEIDVPGEDHP